MTTVLLTDFAWPDDAVERAVLRGAGLQLVAGEGPPGSAAEVEALVRAHAPAAIMTCWAEVSAKAITAAPELKIVQRLGVGLDNIDVRAATTAGVVVANVPDYCIEEVSDHAMALLLAWARGIVQFDTAVKAGVWDPASARLRRVRDLTVGVLGLGRIGGRTAEKLVGFGVRVIAHRRDAAAHAAAGAEIVSFERLLAESDAVIVHLPLTEQTYRLFDDARLAAMKPGAILINVSRGPIVDNGALVRALERGHLSGAALDVVEGEPEPPTELAGRSDVIVTPHIAFSSEASLMELRRRGAEEVVRVLSGQAARHPCNAPGLARSHA
jgi:D-3-phosphoglycerate dehydrogenase